MNRTTLKASLVMVALVAIACGQESTPDFEQESTLSSREDALSSNKALILGSTVSGGTASLEYLAVKKLGISDLNIKVVTNEQWAAMTVAEFATYRVIVLGDAGCANLDAVSAAVANRNVWASAVGGNIFIMGTAPVANNAPVDVTDKGIKFAAAQIGQTGLYVSLSCYYQNAGPNTQVELLEPFGTFMVQGGGCHSTTHIVGSHSALSTLTDAVMSNWSCSVGTQFDSFPQANFSPWAIAKFSPGLKPNGSSYYDGTYGAPYILARGAKLIGCGNGVVNPGEECDYGAEANGLSGSQCSATCRFHWCGDGIQDAGEQCDLGSANGGSSCSRMCRLPAGPPPPPSNRPPVPSCRPVTLSAGQTCGGVGASIDNGSNDPDGNLVGCTQSVTSFELGETVATLTCTDAQGLSASCSSTVKVVDDIAPSISCPEPTSFECGGPAAELANPQAQDNCSSPVLSSNMTGEGYALGTPRTVTWKATDGANEAVCSTSVTMVDTLAPNLSLNGGATQQAECGVPGSYAEAGVVATDKCQGDLSSNVAISGQVDVSAVGTYPITYSVADQVGNSASAVRQVKVADTKAPALALLGDAAVALECGVGSYTEAGAVASDVCNGNLSAKVARSGAVNAAARGSYALTYSVADASGNVASAVRTVSVNDTLAPSIALVGAAAMKLECGVDSFINPGATAVDACAGNLSGAIITSGAVDTKKTGSYAVSYAVADGAGLSASAVRAVEVADTLAPSIALNGASTMDLECGVGSYTEAGATATDACAGSLSSLVSISGTVNAAVRGVYTKTYSVADASGNSASAARTVNVKDTKAPSISLVGAASVKIPVGGTFVDAGATATDSCSGNLTSAIVKSGSVNPAKAGIYTLTYSVVDGAGLSASVSRSVTVEAPSSCRSVNVKPIQQIWPPNHKMWNFDLASCAAVADPCGGPVDINAVGTITSIYSDEVEDAQGNGDGSTLQDIVITGKSSFQLRAERQGKGNGRVYGVNFKVTDSSGNEQTATCKFVVPHDQSGRGGIDDGAAAGYTVNAPAF